MSKKAIGWIVLAIITIVVVLGIVFYRDTKTGPIEEIRIGAILPMTSWAAYVGESCKHGIEMAITNAVLGSRTRLIVEDSANDPKTGLNALRKLKDVDQVPIVFCVMSSVAEAVLTQAPDQPALLSVVSQSRATENRPNAFRYFLSSNMETKAMAAFLRSRGVTNAAFLYVNDDFGLDALNCFSRHFLALGGQIIFHEAFDKAGSQVADIVVKTLAEKPQAVFFAGYGAPIALIAQRLKESRYSGMICSFSSFSAPTVLAQAGSAAEGVFVSTTGFDPAKPSDSVQLNFVKMYETTFGKTPDHYAAYCYDLMSIFLKCWEESDHDLDLTLKRMCNVHSFKGVIGEATCGPDRDFQFPVSVKVIANGTLVEP